jgi:hypothetical protein
LKLHADDEPLSGFTATWLALASLLVPWISNWFPFTPPWFPLNATWLSLSAPPLGDRVEVCFSLLPEAAATCGASRAVLAMGAVKPDCLKVWIELRAEMNKE